MPSSFASSTSGHLIFNKGSGRQALPLHWALPLQATASTRPQCASPPLTPPIPSLAHTSASITTSSVWRNLDSAQPYGRIWIFSSVAAPQQWPALRAIATSLVQLNFLYIQVFKCSISTFVMPSPSVDHKQKSFKKEFETMTHEDSEMKTKGT